MKRRGTYHRQPQGQTMVEFSLVLPLLLLVMFGVIESGRLLLAYSAIYTASREAARYGSAAGNSGSYVAYYQDCGGIRAAARRIGGLAGVEDNDIQITYDQGTSSSSLGSCPVGGVGPNLALGNRITVQVSGEYRPILPVFNIPAIPIASTSSRTLIKNVSIEGNPAESSSGLPQVYFAESTNAIAEGDNGETHVYTLDVLLSEASEQNVIVYFSIGGSASQGVDYSLNRSSPLVIAAGTSGTSLNITVNGDEVDEFDETISLVMDAVTNAERSSPYSHTTTILDDDQDVIVTFVASSQVSNEGEPYLYVTAQIVDSGGSPFVSGKEVLVPFELSGDATALADYALAPNPLVVPIASSDASIILPLIDDTVYEGDETLVVTMGTPVNAVPGAITTHTALIHDNDDPPQVSFTTPLQVVAELTGSAVVTAHLHDGAGAPVSSEVEVFAPFTLTGSATENLDYTFVPSPIVFPPGVSSLDLNVALAQDDLAEPDETITITLGTPVNATLGMSFQHTLVITMEPLVFFTLEEQIVPESALSAEIEIQLMPVQTEDVTVAYSLSGTAQRPLDYTAPAISHVTIPAGQSTAAIPITTVNDGLDEYDETVVVTLLDPENAGLGTPAVHTLTLQDSDQSPSVYFSAASQSVQELDTTLDVQVLLSAVSTKPVTVTLEASGSATRGADYTVAPLGTLIFPPGVRSLPISIDVMDDTLQEANELVVLSLTSPMNASQGTPSSHAVTILLNDQPTCDIFTGNELVINVVDKRVAWTLSNLGQDTLILKSYTIAWPNNAANPPKFDLLKFEGHMVWDGNMPQSPATANAPWIGFDSYRVLTANPATISAYFTRTLLPGNYSVTMLFHNVELGVDCSPVTKSVYQP